MVDRGRRKLLLGSSSILLAGCTGGENDVKDSDGDGMIDSEDYAPNDAAVQAKADIQKTKTVSSTEKKATATDTPTPSPTPSPTSSPIPTESPTPTSTPKSPKLTVDSSYWQGTSHIFAYGMDEVDIVLYDDHDLDFNDLQVVVYLYEFPRGESLGSGTSDTFSRNQLPYKSSISIDGDFPEGERLHYGFYVAKGGVDPSQLSSDEVDFLFETDPFERRFEREIRRSPHPKSLDSVSTGGFQREDHEGIYDITLEGRTSGKSWSVGLTAFKSAYIMGVNRSRGRSRSEYVTYEMTDGNAGELASLLNEEAEYLGITGAREKVEFVIDYVQRFPYVPDDVSKGFDDYTKFIMETFAEGGGDCEDSSILLASVLQSEPFGYDMVLIQPPGHMAVGIKGSSSLDGAYYNHDGNRYYYIETTGSGWGIGDIPQEYDGASAYIYQV